MYRNTRFIVVTVLGAVVFALLFVMTGLVEQFNLEPSDTVEQFGADELGASRGCVGPVHVGVGDAGGRARCRRCGDQVAGGDHPVQRVRRRREPRRWSSSASSPVASAAPQVVEGRAPTAAG